MHTPIAMCLTCFLSVNLLGCNDPTEHEIEIKQLTPSVSADSDNASIDISTGTWENKDEDGDGILDVDDDFPFQIQKSQMDIYQESEHNDYLAVANDPDSAIPFKVAGIVSRVQDLDLYKFTVDEKTNVSVVLKTQNNIFIPDLTIFDNNGSSVQRFNSNGFVPLGYIGGASHFTMPKAGTYYLGISDKKARGDESYVYEAHLFFDTDFDYIPDTIEPAFGLMVGESDSDNDNISDGNEFYSFTNGETLNHDFDGDLIPNWLDDDSDGDGILDVRDGLFDFDFDGLGAFLDLDSDDDGISDKNTVPNPSLSINDRDSDQIPDFADTDDDADGLLDINDPEPLNFVKTSQYGSDDFKYLTDLTFLYGGHQFQGLTVERRTHRLHGEGLTGPGLIVITFDDKRPPMNIPFTTSEQATTVLPEDSSSIYFYKDGTRSNALQFKLKNPNLPLVVSSSKEYYSPADKVVITGFNFFEDARIFINDVKIKPVYKSDEKVSFVLPEDMPAKSYLTVETSYGTSNQFELNVGHEVTLDYSKFSNEKSLVSSLSVASIKSPVSQEQTIGSDLETTLVAGSSHDIAFTMYIDERGEPYEYIHSVVFGTDTHIDITPEHAAASAIWYETGLGSKINDADWRAEFNKLQSMPETIALAKFIATKSTQPKYLSTFSEEYESLLSAGKKATLQLSLQK